MVQASPCFVLAPKQELASNPEVQVFRGTAEAFSTAVSVRGDTQITYWLFGDQTYMLMIEPSGNKPLDDGLVEKVLEANQGSGQWIEEFVTRLSPPFGSIKGWILESADLRLQAIYSETGRLSSIKLQDGTLSQLANQQMMEVAAPPSETAGAAMPEGDAGDESVPSQKKPSIP